MILTGMNRKALSLVEITMSMGILILVMLPTFMTFSSGNQGVHMTAAEFYAHSAALELMEQTMSLPFSMIKSGYYEEGSIINGANFGDSPVQYRLSFGSENKLSMNIEEIKKNNKVVFKKISVNVKYPMMKESVKERDFTIKVIVNNDGK